MGEPRQHGSDKSVLKWGGLAGMAGSVVFVAVFVIVLVFVGSDPNEPADFPDIRVARTLEDGLYLAATMLWLLLFLALYRALRQEHPAHALFGGALGIAGFVVLAAGALPHVATLAISDLLHAPATIDDQAALGLMWQATYAVFDALLIVGLILSTIGVIFLGGAMTADSRFGRGIGWTGVVLGAVGVVSASVLLWNPESPLAVAAVFGLIVFNALAGWRTYRLSGR